MATWETSVVIIFSLAEFLGVLFLEYFLLTLSYKL